MRFDTLQSWLDWQSGLHPSEIELGLERVAEVWSRIHPEPIGCRVITVAGTNGKGSCVAFLDAMLRAGGYRTGCYTSPHLVRYNERIRIDGEEAGDEAICQAFDAIDRARGEISLTYFEFGTLAALKIFADARLDAVVLEVGLGGRLDAVNIIDPDVALITTVDIDHADWLGDNREAIGREKAGIMCQGVPAICADQDPPGSVIQRAAELPAPLFLAGRDFTSVSGEQGWQWKGPDRQRHSLPYPYLRGGFQLRNASAALMALECLADALPLDQQAVRIGLQEARLAGRFQTVGRDPQIILDVAHNPQAARTLAENLRDAFCPGTTRAVFGMLADKEIEAVAATLAPLVDYWHISPLQGARSATGTRLEEAVKQAGVETGRVSVHGGVGEALSEARRLAGEGDRILIVGSFHTVGQALDLLQP